MSREARASFSEHDAEPVPGLPGPLPEGESILWQGRPGWEGIARRALHLRGLALYFGALALWRGLALSSDGADLHDALFGAGWMVLLGAVPVAMLGAYAWFSARGTLYTITTRRVVVRTGVALPMTVNIPFAVIASAALAKHGDGTGDIALQVMPPHRVSWVALWPYTRPWRLARPEPSLRAVAEPEKVAQLLSRALAGAAAMPVRPIGEAPADRAAAKPAAAMA
jgi:hypothetical protein